MRSWLKINTPIAQNSCHLEIFKNPFDLEMLSILGFLVKKDILKSIDIQKNVKLAGVSP